MSQRSSVSRGVVLKQIRRFAPHPWIAAQLIKLELEKRFFNLVNPLRDQGWARRIRQVSIRITDICNLRCHTCGQWGDSGFLHGQDLKQLKKEEVSPQRYLELFRDLADHGHRPNVYFWGGEPMLYSGIVDLIEGAAELRLPPSIATNGTRVAAMAERLVKAPLFLLQISIDGHDAAAHNASRPAAGGGDNFNDIQNGLAEVNRLRRSFKTNLPLIASLTTISRNNFRHLADIYRAFRDKVDMFVFYPAWWISRERALEHEKDFFSRFGFKPTIHRGWIGSWRPDDYQVLEDQFRILSDLSRPFNAPPVTVIPPVRGTEALEAYYTDHAETFGFNSCVSIYQVVELNSNGDLSPCRDYHDYVVGNIKEQTITGLWNSPAYRRFRQSLTRQGLMPVCSRCCGLMGY